MIRDTHCDSVTGRAGRSLGDRMRGTGHVEHLARVAAGYRKGSHNRWSRRRKRSGRLRKGVDTNKHLLTARKQKVVKSR